MTERSAPWPSGVAVVGAGTMGIGIAQVFAAYGIPTLLTDRTPELADAGRERSLALLSRLAQAGIVDHDVLATAEQHLRAAPSITDGVQGADLVVEAVVEDLEVKRQLFAKVSYSFRR